MDSTTAPIEALISSITTSIENTTKALPDESAIAPNADGISLLDAKTEIFLSYLQNAVFLLFLKLQELGRAAEEDEKKGLPLLAPEPSPLDGKVREKLAELRLYLDKGVGPIENKLKYQITQALNIADNAQRLAAQVSAHETSRKSTKADDSSDNNDDGSESSSGSESSDEELTYAPNLSTMKPGLAQQAAGSRNEADPDDSKSGLYRPPKIAPTALPELPRYGKDPADDRSRDPRKSRTLDEFVSTEMAAAPAALPSVGSNIASMGRRMKSDKDRRDEVEREVYEETNFVRLATKPKKKDKLANQRARASQYGGEDWRDLNVGVDRINKLTSKTSGRSRATDTLERSRKRSHADDDGNNGNYREGDAFKQKRKKVMRMRGKDM